MSTVSPIPFQRQCLGACHPVGALSGNTEHGASMPERTGRGHSPGEMNASVVNSREAEVGQHVEYETCLAEECVRNAGRARGSPRCRWKNLHQYMLSPQRGHRWHSPSWRWPERGEALSRAWGKACMLIYLCPERIMNVQVWCAPERVSDSDSDWERIRDKAAGKTMGFSGHISHPWIKVHYSFSGPLNSGGLRIRRRPFLLRELSKEYLRWLSTFFPSESKMGLLEGIVFLLTDKTTHTEIWTQDNPRCDRKETNTPTKLSHHHMALFTWKQPANSDLSSSQSWSL